MWTRPRCAVWSVRPRPLLPPAACYLVVPLVDPEVEPVDDGGVVGVVDEGGIDEDDEEPRGNGASS